jgi:hypothetical protein
MDYIVLSVLGFTGIPSAPAANPATRRHSWKRVAAKPCSRFRDFCYGA